MMTKIKYLLAALTMLTATSYAQKSFTLDDLLGGGSTY